MTKQYVSWKIGTLIGDKRREKVVNAFRSCIFYFRKNVKKYKKNTACHPRVLRVLQDRGQCTDSTVCFVRVCARTCVCGGHINDVFEAFSYTTTGNYLSRSNVT